MAYFTKNILDHFKQDYRTLKYKKINRALLINKIKICRFAVYCMIFKSW